MMKTTKTLSPRLKLMSCVLIGWLVTLPMTTTAADMTAGYSFTPNDRVTSTKLNNLVGAGSINTTFISDKTTAQPQAADTFGFLSISASAYRKTTLNTLLLQNTNLIVSQTYKAPLTNDSFLLYSAADNALRKTALLDIVTNTAFIDLQVRTTNAPPGGGLLTYSSNGVFYGIAVSNLLQETWRWMPLSTNSPTNSVLSLHTSPTNDDLLLIWDSVAKTNKSIRLSTLISNSVQTTQSITNSNDVMLWGIRTNDTNVVALKPRALFPVATNYQPIPNSNLTYTNNHGLPGIPQLIRSVIVCTNADGDFVPGDEVELIQVSCNGIRNGNCSVACDAGKVYVSYQGAANTWAVFEKTPNTTFNITKGSWNLKWYARWFPP